MKRIIATLALLTAITCIATAQLQEGLALKYLVQQPAKPSAHPPVIIILHGYGSDEQDMFGMRTAMPGNYIVIAARAPYQVQGGEGYQWFEKETLNGRFSARPADVANSDALIAQFISQVVARYHADAGSVYLTGFSQGAIMSYQVGLTHPALLKGIGVLSGLLLPPLQTGIKSSPALQKLRIFVAHGTADNRLSFADGKAAADHLKALGLRPEFHEYPGMAHTISSAVMADLVRWLR